MDVIICNNLEYEKNILQFFYFLGFLGDKISGMYFACMIYHIKNLIHMITLPGYLKLAVVLFITFMVIAFLYVASAFLIPLVFAILLSFLLLPVSRFLTRKGLHHGISIVLSILLALVVIGGIAFFFYTQIQSFAEDGPMLKEKFNEKVADIQQYISQNFSVSKREQKQFVEEQTETLKESGGDYLSTFFSFTGTMLAAISLIPIYIFFFTYYKKKIKIFICKLIPESQNKYIIGVIGTTAKVSQKYIQGLLIDIGILAVLNYIGFQLLGIEHAILLALMAAILNLVPYIGVFIGSIFPFAMALLTKDESWVAFAAVGVCVVVQFLDNNFITPKVVGSSVSINPLATLLAIIVGGFIWGVMGMMLFIPLLGMAKVVLDSFPESQPYGYLIGEEEEYKPKMNLPAFLKRRFS